MILGINLIGKLLILYFIIHIINCYGIYDRRELVRNPIRIQAYYEPWDDSSKWLRVSQSRYTRDNERYKISQQDKKPDEGRHFRPETLHAITETLGAINTVGRYLVNMTRGGETDVSSGDVPSAIYTISKNFLGKNVTETIAPLVREALPGVIHQNLPETVTPENKNPRSCTTPDGSQGYCDDLSDCPQLLLNLGNLRQSLCFKSLFVPGVCCPKPTNEIEPTTSFPLSIPTTVNIKPQKLTPVSSSPPLQIKPVAPTGGNIVDPNDCGQPESAKFRVVGGEESLPGRWPWMAAIFLHGTRRTEFWCGGSLVSSRHVITAAHCTRDSKQRPFAARQFTVRLGDIDLKRDDEPSAPVTFKVSDIKAHPEFSRIGFYNDIAILVLDRPARKSRYVIPLCLPPPQLKNEKFAGKRTTVVGWGTTYYGGKESTVQRQAVLPIWRNEDCDQAYFQPITSNFICAGYSEGGTDACQGDSGGPLMLHWDTRWMQVGIVSFGNKCGEPGYPGVYTRITEYLDWIRQNMKT